MKKVIRLLSLLILVPALVTINGCKKPAASTSVDGHILSINDAYTSNGQTSTTVTTYSYDAQGRQVLATPNPGTPTSTVYGTGTVTQTSGSNVVTYQLNSQGLATSDNQGNTYTYNSNGYLITLVNGADYEINTIANGNIIADTIIYNGAQTTLASVYSTNVDYRNKGISFQGKNSIDLYTSVAITQSGTITNFAASFTFDSKERVATATLTSGTSIEVFTYTYTTN